MSPEAPSVMELTEDECWELLEQEQFARLAFRLVDEVHLVPLNYLVDERAILIRTASGNKLLAAALESDVAMEIDWHDDTAAWSVVVRGRLRRLPDIEHHRLDGRPEQPWVPTHKPEVVELMPTAVTGRSFVLRQPDAGQREPVA